jgi:periplasmic copper chaperone A
VVELVDAADSKSAVRKDVPVQVRSGAPCFINQIEEHNMLKKILVTLIALISISANVYAEQKTAITITDSWVRPTMGSKRTSAAYMNIINPTEKADILYKVTSPQAKKIELHKIVSDDKGVDHMIYIDKIVIPAGQKVELAPKGLHIMLFQLKQTLAVGDNIELTLYFEQTGEMKITVPVTSLKKHGK